MTRRKTIDISETALGEPAPVSAALPTLDAASSDRKGIIRAGKLAGRSMWGAIWVLSWPVLLESLLNSLVGVVDTMLAAGVSEASADAIGGATYFMWFVVLFAVALGVGATAMISRAMGRGRRAIASAVVGQSVTLSIITGVIVTAIVWMIAPLVARILNLSGQAYDEAVMYMSLCSIAVPLQTIASVGIACCRGAGDAVRPLALMIFINLVNLAASIYLSGVDLATGTLDSSGAVVRHVIFHNPSPFDMGVRGIALGTAIAWSLGGLVMLWMLVGGVHGITLRAKRLKPHLHTILRLVRIGIPNMWETFSLWLGNFLVILLVGWMNDPGLLGANVITVRIEAFSFLPGFAMSLAAATLAGTYLGAGSPALARRAILRCAGIASVLMGIGGLAFMLFPRPITGLFSQQAAHLEFVPRLLVIAGSIQTFFAVSIVLRGALRGAGDTRAVMWITIVSIWLVRLPLAWLGAGIDLPLPWGGSIPNPAPLASLGVHPLEGLWIGLCIEILVRSSLFARAFFAGRWSDAKV